MPGLWPGRVPTADQDTPGDSTLVAGEAVPGVFVELRLPRTTFVAGAVIQPELRVRNTTSADIEVRRGLAAVPDRLREPSGRPTVDRRGD